MISDNSTSPSWVEKMISSFTAKLDTLYSQKENKYGHIFRLKTANIDFLTIEEMVPTHLPFVSLFVDINFSRFEIELVYQKITLLKNLLDDIALINSSRTSQLLKPKTRIMTMKDKSQLMSLNRFPMRDINKLKKATIKDYFNFLRNTIRLKTLMVKKKFSQEKALSVILNDEFSDNLILRHMPQDLIDLEQSQTKFIPNKESNSSMTPQNFQTIKSMKSNAKQRMIFDKNDESFGGKSPSLANKRGLKSSENVISSKGPQKPVKKSSKSGSKTYIYPFNSYR
jgi:hypothetical protein